MSDIPTSIVIADDDRAIAELLCTIFDEEGYSVECCYSGQAAIEAVQRHQPDLVILEAV
jgi:two-component system, OmpR family, response regulator